MDTGGEGARKEGDTGRNEKMWNKEDDVPDKRNDDFFCGRKIGMDMENEMAR
jgi:hypothetical protein